MAQIQMDSKLGVYLRVRLRVGIYVVVKPNASVGNRKNKANSSAGNSLTCAKLSMQSVICNCECFLTYRTPAMRA
jgi:hypothetical protein